MVVLEVQEGGVDLRYGGFYGRLGADGEDGMGAVLRCWEGLGGGVWWWAGEVCVGGERGCGEGLGC